MQSGVPLGPGKFHLVVLVSIYTRGNLGVSSNFIGSLSLANENYSLSTEGIIRDLNRNKLAGLTSRFARVSESKVVPDEEG